MNDVGVLYRASVTLGCLTLMLASIACTGWFFYSWLGGVAGIVGALVGCAVQLMAYGFSGVIVHQKDILLKIILFSLISSALALSVLSSYATLNGYFKALQAENEASSELAQQKDQARQAVLSQRMQLLESMSRDVEIGSDAANQGIDGNYRTQASEFLETNAATRSEMVAQIENVEQLADSQLFTQPEAERASPIDGLSELLGGQNLTIVILCLWLAIMFDALPIVGITLFEAKAKQKRALKRAHLDKETHFVFSDSFEDPEYGLPSPDNSESETLLVELDPPHLEEEQQFKLLVNICSRNLQTTKQFFVDLLDFEIKYDSDWYIQLCSPTTPDSEFGIIQYDHELVPNRYRRRLPGGMYLTIVVPDVDACYERALAMDMDIIQPPKNEFYGQRRFLVAEPSGCLIDICSPWSEEDMSTNEAEILFDTHI